MNKHMIALALLVLAKASCTIDTADGDTPREGEGEGEGEATDATAEVIAFMRDAHTQMRSTFATQEEQLSADLSASGGFTSGAHITRSISENLSPAIDAFFNSVVDVVNASPGTVDGARLRGAAEAHKSDDLSFFESYYHSVPWITRDTARQAAVASARDAVNAGYASGIARLP